MKAWTFVNFITETHKPVSPDDPDAVRARYTGMEPGKYDVKHPKYEPSGELLKGETGYAKPIRPEHRQFMWVFTSDRGFTMMVPPHDLEQE